MLRGASLEGAVGFALEAASSDRRAAMLALLAEFGATLEKTPPGLSELEERALRRPPMRACAFCLRRSRTVLPACCTRACFCGPECQLARWPEHIARCTRKSPGCLEEMAALEYVVAQNAA